MKYFQLLDTETLEVYVSQDLDKQPNNSIPFFENDFIKAIFDVYPNPKKVIEGLSNEDINIINQEKYNLLDAEYTTKISELVDKHVQKFIIDGTLIPQEVIDERERLKQEFYELTNKELKK